MEPVSFKDLPGKVCVITGGAGGIGLALVRAMASVNMKIAVVGRNKAKADKAAAEVAAASGATLIGVEGNVLDKASLEKARTVVHEKLGEIDVLINGAGGNHPSATTKVDRIEESHLDHPEDTFYGLQMDGFEKVLNLNFKGTVLSCMVFTQDMLKRRKGVILNVSSMNSFKPLTKVPAYSAAKAAINNFTAWLAVHLARVGIRVNAIAPGFFLTNQNRFLLLDEKNGGYSARGCKIISNTPMGKLGEPEDLQGATLFLLSDISSFVTGVVIPVDGGFSAFGGV